MFLVVSWRFILVKTLKYLGLCSNVGTSEMLKLLFQFIVYAELMVMYDADG